MWLLAMGMAVLQASAPERPHDLRCGGYCLYVALKGLDLPAGSFEELEKLLGQPSSEGYSLGQLQEAAQRMGAQTLAVSTSLENLARRGGRFACIVPIAGSHFVLLADAAEDDVLVLDPPKPSANRIPRDTFESRWNHMALLISADPLVREEDLPRVWNWRAGLAWGLGGAAVVLLTLAGWRRWARSGGG